MASVSQFANANTVVATGWTNPTNAYADDGSYATAAPAKSTSITTDYGFPGLAIPALSTLTSVTFEFQYKSDTTGSTSAVIGLQGNNNGSLMGSETTFGMSLTDSTQTKQYTTSLPTVASLNAANTVKARVRGFRSTSNTAITWSCDYVKITVVYTPGYTLVCDQGSFAESGQVALFQAAMLAAQGSFAESGQAVLFQVGMPAAQASFAMAGEVATLKAARLLGVAQGSFAGTGESVSLSHGYRSVEAQGAFSESGQTAGLVVSRKLTVTDGAVAVGGEPASFAVGRRLSCDAASVSMTGSDAQLTYSGGGGGDSPAPQQPSRSIRIGLRF